MTHGADIEALTIVDETPLCLAINGGFLPVVKVNLSNGVFLVIIIYNLLVSLFSRMAASFATF